MRSSSVPGYRLKEAIVGLSADHRCLILLVEALSKRSRRFHFDNGFLLTVVDRWEAAVPAAGFSGCTGDRPAVVVEAL